VSGIFIGTVAVAVVKPIVVEVMSVTDGHSKEESGGLLISVRFEDVQEEEKNDIIGGTFAIADSLRSFAFFFFCAPDRYMRFIAFEYIRAKMGIR
jgi:hypothetical protein